MDQLSVDENLVRDIPLKDISPSPYQPRVHFNEKELDELAASIREKGILQPILLRPVEGKATPLELVIGERRWRASDKAGRDTIRSIVKALSDEDAREITLVENLQREDLTPIEEARGIKAHVEAHGGNKAATARVIGKPEGYVHDALALLELPGTVQNMLDARILNKEQARVILEIEGENKQIEGAKLAEKLTLSAVQLRARMQKHINKGSGGGSTGERRPASPTKVSQTLVAAYESLEDFNFEDLDGSERGLKNREMLQRQVLLLKQRLTRAERELTKEPPVAKPAGETRPPRLVVPAS